MESVTIGPRTPTPRNFTPVVVIRPARVYKLLVKLILACGGEGSARATKANSGGLLYALRPGAGGGPERVGAGPGA